MKHYSGRAFKHVLDPQQEIEAKLRDRQKSIVGPLPQVHNIPEVHTVVHTSHMQLHVRLKQHMAVIGNYSYLCVDSRVDQTQNHLE